jgi:dUTP pyrophosphatase
MKVKVCKADPDSLIKVPAYATEGAAGFDLTSAESRCVELGPGNKYGFKTGLKFEIPDGYEMQVRPRSGLAFKHGVATTFGTVDSDYRGEVMINLINHGRTSMVITPGDRIAQGVIVPVTRVEFEMVDELTKTVRGSKGFGSNDT